MEFNLSNLSKNSGSKNRKTRIGRGVGSGHGGHASTRGLNGLKARTGGKVPWYFEGGQLPLFKRLPFLVGFKSRKKKSLIIKTSQLNDSKLLNINPKTLLEKGIIKKVNKKNKIKIVYDAPLDTKLKLKGVKYSKKVHSER